MQKLKAQMKTLAQDVTAAPGKPRERLNDLVLDKSELQRPGGALLAALLAKAAQNGVGLKEVAMEMGVTYSYLAQLRTGVRKISQISDDMVDACSEYLRWPRLAVLIAAAKIRPSDIFDSPLRMPAMLDKAMNLIASDPVYGPWFPLPLMQADDATKHFVVRLYEDASGQNLLPYDEPEQD